jgi:UDP-N-acetylmuramoyl-tripeptide--D-alanyl-D-alanine ligase
MKSLVIKLLAFFSKVIIKKYKPRVIAITGSVGKTGTKEFVSFVLSAKFKVRASIKNYNNELGLPLSIIGVESPARSVGGWFRVFLYFLKLILWRDRNYPDILVLEMGIDKPGDMDYLLSILKIDVGIITNISHSHLKNFSDLNEIKREKLKLVEDLEEGGLAILNTDNDYLRDYKEKFNAKSFSYGLKPGADFLAEDISLFFNKEKSDNNFCGINFKLRYQEKVLPVRLSGVISFPYIYSSLAALSLAGYFDFNLVEVAERLNKAPVLPGRMRPLLGIKGTIIIDDTYNSSPESAQSALDALKRISLESGRRIAILGDMLELGDYTEKGHRLVGEKLSESDVDLLILIGDKSRNIGKSAIEKGFDKKNVFYFSEIKEVSNFIEDNISSGDVLLFKASQGIRLEKLVERVMLEKEKAEEFLVRQEPEWN